MKKAQAAIEFLSTYGFAILTLFITIGALNYFGLFNLASFQSNQCNFPQGAECMDYTLGNADPGTTLGEVPPLPPISAPYLRVILFNAYNTNLNITSATMNIKQFANLPCSADTPVWNANTNTTLWCAIPPALFTKRERYNGAVTLNFTQTGVYTHSIKGVFSVESQ